MAPDPDHGASDPHAARRAALQALEGILGRGMTMDRALAHRPAFAHLGASDRAFVRLLVVTALRRKGEIDAVLAACLERPLASDARKAAGVLALGAAQLLFLGTPPHAAVDTAVALAARVSGGRYRALVNAVLRRIAREGQAIRAGIDAPRANTPDWLWTILADAYGEPAARRIAVAHMEEPPLDITLRDPSEAEAWAEPLDARILPTGGLRRATGGAVEALPGYAAGAWWVQDAAASLPARLFPAPRGRRILDLCAAPGGKALQLAAAGASVTALDRSPERLARLGENFTRIGVAAETVCADALDYAPAAPFDGVLLDAPCTATGTLRRHPEIPHIKDLADAARLVPIQDALLEAAARLTAPGGVLVYTVCSLDPEEGDRRVDIFLRSHPDFARKPIDPRAIGGDENWVTEAGDLRTQPYHMGDLGGMDGFYAARLQRLGEAAT